MTAPASTRAAARTVLRIDAALDTTIAVGCVLLATSATTGAWARPDWLGAGVLLVLAAVLVAFAAALLWLAGRPDAVSLTALGAGNGVCAVILLGWAVVEGATAPALRVLTVVVALALAAVAIAQLRTARRL